MSAPGASVYVLSVSRFSSLDKEFPVKALSFVGALLLILGILVFVVPVPHKERHGVKLGDSDFSIQTESSDRLPPAVGFILVGGGVVALILGLRKA
jgi:hypothetical protein